MLHLSRLVSVNVDLARLVLVWVNVTTFGASFVSVSGVLNLPLKENKNTVLMIKNKL